VASTINTYHLTRLLPFAAKQIPGGNWGRTEVGMGVKCGR
jgi:hypothetical protein